MAKRGGAAEGREAEDGADICITMPGCCKAKHCKNLKKKIKDKLHVMKV